LTTRTKMRRERRGSRVKNLRWDFGNNNDDDDDASLGRRRIFGGTRGTD
jgi:hypothetical protein